MVLSHLKAFAQKVHSTPFYGRSNNQTTWNWCSIICYLVSDSIFLWSDETLVLNFTEVLLVQWYCIEVKMGVSGLECFPQNVILRSCFNLNMVCSFISCVLSHLVGFWSNTYPHVCRHSCLAERLAVGCARPARHHIFLSAVRKTRNVKQKLLK